jgi:phosphoribosylformylglycinamidine synthase
MSAYEVMLSESQERMLLVVRPEGVESVLKIVAKWSLHGAAIGRITGDGMVRVRDGDAVVAEVPAPLFTDECPSYIRPAAESEAVRTLRARDPLANHDISPEMVGEVTLQLLRSPNIGSRRPIYERYDHTILTNTVVPPGMADAAVLRIKGTDRAIAAAIDCNSRYCYLDPQLGGALAVAEATRNVSCVGAMPLAITNCLNFGNPEKPNSYYQLDRAVSGMAEACAALGVPVVSGNVSLYNETADAAVMPTPTVGAVGLIESSARHATMRWQDGDAVLLIGSETAKLGASEYLAHVHGTIAGRPPRLNLELERRVQELVRSAIADGIVRTAHDCADGGLAIALAEMAIVSDLGVSISADFAVGANRIDAVWFGETASRVIVACVPEAARRVADRARASDVPVTEIGVVGGRELVLGPAARLDLQRARDVYEQALGELS